MDLHQEHVNAVWVYQLNTLFEKVNNKVFMRLKIELQAPIFSIEESMGAKWGEWNPTRRTIRLNRELFTHFEWSAVEHVMKHEMAHQIVSEIFDINVTGCPHGEIWKTACETVGVEPVRCCDSNYLNAFQGQVESPVVNRIRKLLAKGGDSSVTEEEAQLFMNKAQEIMLRHNVSMREVMGADVLWVKRPVGERYKTLPSWLYELANLVRDHYNVKCLSCYSYSAFERYRHMELFGSADNVDVAEYVFCAILNQADILFKQAHAEHKRNMKEDEDYFIEHSHISWNKRKRAYVRRADKFTQYTFMTFLVKAYASKLYTHKKTAIRRIEAEDGVLVTTNDRILNEMYGEFYPNLKSIKLACAHGSAAAGQAGREAGNDLHIGHGVTHSNGNRNRYLGG